MHKTVVIDIVGLSARLIGEHTPFIRDWAAKRQLSAIRPMLPAVTTAVQSTYVTGKWPSTHGVVGNGWYDRSDCEIKFWKQANTLVQAEKIWEKAKREDPSFTCSKMFWWYNMYSTADYSVTPRPQYRADGLKIPDCYAHPSQLRDRLQKELGQFPLFHFWGPAADIRSSRWIAEASMKVDTWHDPTLTLIYLPHLDYCLQKYGPDLSRVAGELREIDEVVADLVRFYEKKDARILLLSEYGITSVNHPVHLNRIFRKHGLISVREENGLELLDAAACKAFAVADHQIAHVYINDPSCEKEVRNILESTPGIGQLLDAEGKRQHHLDHHRSGDYVAVADEKSWFTYYYWQDDRKAPDYARVVDIHRKPGYDPVEMFMSSKLRAAYKLLRKKLGLRYVMDVIPLDATLVRGSHGRVAASSADHPVLIGTLAEDKAVYSPVDIRELIWQQLVS
ncbi:nucleotide pyrophosphatase/phosphodiesterase family protein [Compostibacter hankyongensis]